MHQFKPDFRLTDDHSTVLSKCSEWSVINNSHGDWNFEFALLNLKITMEKWYAWYDHVNYLKRIFTMKFKAFLSQSIDGKSP